MQTSIATTTAWLYSLSYIPPIGDNEKLATAERRQKQMNLPQKISLSLGGLVMAFLSLRPPWISVIIRPAVRFEEALGFFFIWHDFGQIYARPDFARLILELFPVVVITVALVMTLRAKNE